MGRFFLSVAAFSQFTRHFGSAVIGTTRSLEMRTIREIDRCSDP
jgi:hypothetical protein